MLADVDAGHGGTVVEVDKDGDIKALNVGCRFQSRIGIQKLALCMMQDGLISGSTFLRSSTTGFTYLCLPFVPKLQAWLTSEFMS